MRLIKKSLIYLLTITMLSSYVLLVDNKAYAHDILLDVKYDACYDPSHSSGDGTLADGIDETWYILTGGAWSSHLATEIDTITYYFEDSSINGNSSWTTEGISQDMAEEIKEAYADSMKKWNNVYYYAYDTNGNVTKKKLINIVEGTKNEHNLTIYPEWGTNRIAATGHVGLGEDLEMINYYGHKHYNEWEMVVNLDHFYVHDFLIENYVNVVREKAGAHEIGHVLGLYDVENYCKAEDIERYHHYEILMGYGSTIDPGMPDITYKDIAGVAITRGFHTDNDHKWLYKEMVNGKYKMICSICNGVKWIDSFAGYSYGVDYFLYGLCYNNHALSSGNMMAVACYGDKDYYKCKYCRYVAPFDATVTQNYSITTVDSTYHQYTNQVAGLNYTIVEKHDLNPDGCYTCGYGHTHTYSSSCVYFNTSSHAKTCACGSRILESHAVERSKIVNNRYAKCEGCGADLDLQIHQAEVILSLAEMVSLNGSYILPNGIIVLEELDVEAYLNGTLQFYPANDLPQTQ